MSVPFVVIPRFPVSRQTGAGLMKRQPSAGFLKPPWCQFLLSSSPGCPCLQANQGRPDKKATQAPVFDAALVSVPFIVTPGLPVSRQTRAGLMKRQPSAGFLKPPWCQFLSSPSAGCPCLQANQGRPDKKATQRRLFEAALVSVPFAVIHGLPVSRQIRADLIIKATQGRLFK